VTSTLRRSALLASATAALVGLTAGAALACPPYLPGVKQSQRAYNREITSIGKTLPSALAGTRTLMASKAGSKPEVVRFNGTLTRNPDSNNADAMTTPANTCAAPVCKELDVVVPAGGNQTLYARAAWTSTTQYVQIWGIAPDGSVVGNSKTSDTIDKRVGNADLAPVAEFTVADPKPGKWKIQVRAVFGYQIPVQSSVALVKAPALEMPQLDVQELANHYMTQDMTYNIVMVNRKWQADELAAFKAVMPDEYQSAVLVKQGSDGCSNDADPPADQVVSESSAGTLANWGTSYYCGTNGSGYKPYFEPIKFRIHYRYLEADRTWTKDLFTVMKKNTKRDQPFSVTGAVGGRRQTQGQYITQYNSENGAYRGVDHVVANPTVGDKIDAFDVEDWVFQHRLDKNYAHAFKDVTTGRLHSGAFINPDPSAYFDPFYTARTKTKKDLDRLPQGPMTSVTFFALDTFGSNADGDFTKDYFRPNAYHYFDVSEHMVDPDLKDGSGPDMARAWGGRYRFFLHDLGAGPNAYESADTALTQNYGGSASYPYGDPPIWDYTSNPQWSGQLGARTARDARIWLFSRFLGSYLYRPVPADVYLLADSNWQDCASNPECSKTGISYTDLTKIYSEDYVRKNLGAALPGATFNTINGTAGFTQNKHLGCSTTTYVAQPDPSLYTGDENAQQALTAPNPACAKNDPLQQLLENAKARGDELAGGVNDVAANPAVVRAYVEAHRQGIAPQPPGQFTLTNISVVWPGATTWALPALVGGIAFGTPNGEGWGNLNNVNDRVKSADATVCDRSKPFAPGCNGVPPISGGAGFSYTIEHESSHFLGLLHPHDYVLVSKGAKGKFDYYGDGFAKYADFSMAPTTYAGAFAPYSVLDQDIIQRGHAAEYLRQAQDYLADAYLQDGMAGRATVSALTKQKETQVANWRGLGSRLYGCGDYLHAEHAMRNAALAAQGVFGPVVKPRALKAGEKVLFSVDPQQSYDVDGKVACVGSQGAVAPSPVRGGVSAGNGHLAATGLASDIPAALALVVLTLVGLAWRRRAA
jgi:hypothetical protein